MRLLTRAEEIILIAVWKLQEKAYSVPIREELMEVTGKYWSFEAVYMTLERLVKKKYLDSYLADPTQERGGRSKRIYKVTPVGLEALKKIKEIYKASLKGLEELSFGEPK